jgi:ribonuclease HII
MATNYDLPVFGDDLPLCGIDEAGRGPLAGSLVIAGVVIGEAIDGLDDSKRLTEKRREELFPIILEHTHNHIVSFSPQEVDDLGISECLRRGLRSIQSFFGDEVNYLYDGNSTFGVSGLQTLVKADAKVQEVAAASILAKVTHDREIIAAADLYPQYGFEKHKGYGTKAHIQAIIQHGRCPIHRQSFRIKQIDEPALF